MEEIDVVIIGAGVVGLATAAEIGARHPELSVTVLEQHETFGQEISSRNSEVIHAGIYYPSDSLKAFHCVEGKEMLYSFCEKWEIPHKKPGKLIVACTEEDIPLLEGLQEQARQNGVLDLEMLDQKQVVQLEPNIQACGALFSPSTGIVDAYRLMARLEWLAKQQEVLPAYCHEVIGVDPQGEQYLVWYYNPDGSTDKISCRWLINCAGLMADRVVSWLGIDPEEAGYRIHPCKGEYFSVDYAKSQLVRHLVYPPPLEHLQGLGIHVTKTLDGRLRLGPNATYVENRENLNYNVEISHQHDFWEAVQPFLPFLEYEDLAPEMAGIRPKLQGPGQPFRDFVVEHEKERGLPGVINLVGIESPGLTAALSLARQVKGIISTHE